ncbi:peptide pheromone inhibitor Ipd [Enterococcus faecalis]|uniref:peptide pheromone inhibitor Ipd n=1 Tax=Enterococcus faecalis TaxID=1351 RepID=UPI00396A9C0B
MSEVRLNEATKKKKHLAALLFALILTLVSLKKSHTTSSMTSSPTHERIPMKLEKSN